MDLLNSLVMTKDGCGRMPASRQRSGRVKLHTETGGVLGVRKGRDKHGAHVRLTIDQGGPFEDSRTLTPPEAIRLGNALIKAAQPKQKREG